MHGANILASYKILCGANILAPQTILRGADFLNPKSTAGRQLTDGRTPMNRRHTAEARSRREGGPGGAGAPPGLSVFSVLFFANLKSTGFFSYFFRNFFS